VSLLDEKDIIISRLNSKIDRLEKDNFVLVDRNAMLHDNLEQLKNKVKQLQEVERQHLQLQKTYSMLYSTLEQISTGEVEDPVSLSKRRLENVN
jgi:predicted RNase H-like nuclease (RuvC/YqgF family)